MFFRNIKGQSLKKLSKEELINELTTERNILQAILAAMPVGIFITDDNGQVIQVNGLVEQIMGGPMPKCDTIADYAVFQGWCSQTGKKIEPDKWSLIRAITKGETSVGEIIDIRRFDGTWGSIINSASPIKDDEGNIIGGVVVIQDNTEQRQREKELIQRRDSLERLAAQKMNDLFQFQMTLDNIPDSFIILDQNWRFVYMNRAVYERLGLKQNQLKSKKFWTMWPIASADAELLKKVMEKREATILETPLANGEWCEMCIYPSDAGETLVYARDITARKKMVQELSRLDKLNVIGQMAAGISHEVRNPLTTVRGFLQLFLNKSVYEKDKEVIQLMISELDRANGIITEFLSIAKDKRVDKKIQSIDEIIINMKPLLEAMTLEAGQNISFELNGCQPLNLDDKEIRQLLLNLIRNAIEAMPKKGRIFVKTECVEKDIILSIRDQGKGISPEVLSKIGTPFFTTKDQGTGLGLSTCYGIASRHNAKIDIDTSSRGTKFIIRFNTAF